MSEIKKLEPQIVWNNFAEICNIPHPSKKEEKISQFIQNFGKKLNLPTMVDEVGNVIIKKPATSGFEDRKTIVLQGHIDMVTQKNPTLNHNFDTDPIKTIIDGEWVKADGTTLGADNGIGVAAALAILESNDIKHGPIEALFTIDEETGMTGAFGLKPGLLDAEILMNLDSEDEGELYVGCAGGVNTNITFTATCEQQKPDSIAYQISVEDLSGGHSGLNIILGRANAIKVLNRVLWEANKRFSIQINAFEGGNAANAIPRSTFAKIAINKDKASELEKFVKEIEIKLKNEFSAVDPNLKLVCNKIENLPCVIDSKTTNNLLNSLYAVANGVIRMSDEVEGLVETSTNIGIIKIENNSVKIVTSQRSSVNSAKEDIMASVYSTFDLASAKVEHLSSYPGWKPNMNSPILKTMQKVYKDKYGKTPEIKAVHAGLECGLFSEVYPSMDMISFGPTIRYPHSPSEKVNIPSVKMFWDFLLATLENTPKK